MDPFDQPVSPWNISSCLVQSWSEFPHPVAMPPYRVDCTSSVILLDTKRCVVDDASHKLRHNFTTAAASLPTQLRKQLTRVGGTDWLHSISRASLTHDATVRHSMLLTLQFFLYMWCVTQPGKIKRLVGIQESSRQTKQLAMPEWADQIGCIWLSISHLITCMCHSGWHPRCTITTADSYNAEGQLIPVGATPLYALERHKRHCVQCCVTSQVLSCGVTEYHSSCLSITTGPPATIGGEATPIKTPSLLFVLPPDDPSWVRSPDKLSLRFCTLVIS